MNYELAYNNLVSSRKERGWTKESAPVYTESHHIIPRSMGGTDDEFNLVRLTAREHILAHALLAKAYGGKFWQIAYGMIFDKNGERKPSRILAMIREEGRKKISESMIGNKNGATPCSEETKRKLSELFKGRTYSDEAMINFRIGAEKRRGRKQSEESNANRSASMKANGFVPVRAGEFEVCSKAGKANKGVKKPPRTEEHIRNMAAAKTGRPNSKSRLVSIDGITYTTQANAARSLEMSKHLVKSRLNSKNPVYKDWYFIEEAQNENT